MARPLRYEAAGAVYHVIARGEGRRQIFGDEKDRESWREILERSCNRFGWRVHAWVLMGNHYHLLLETPEPNLAEGMKWMQGVFTLAWNRRRRKSGPLFQGRYKAVVVDSQERKGDYFRIVADYIHLNPVRAGLVGGTSGKALASWAWSSLVAYGERKRPDWLETGKVLAAFELAEGKRGPGTYLRHLEERAKDRKAVMNEESNRALRRGWYLGGKSFREKLVRVLAGNAKPPARKRNAGSVSGKSGHAHDEHEAERLVKAALKVLGLPPTPEELTGRGKWRLEKSLVAALVRGRTSVRSAWLAQRLSMGHESSISHAVRQVREDPEWAAQWKKLERKLG